MRTDLPQDFTFEHSELSETAFVEQDHITLGQRPSHVISMLHGIQTSGMWAAKLQFAARKKGLQVLPQPISYGWFGVLPFLFRLGTRRIERLVLSELKEIQERFPEASHSIVAHSNGTKLVASLLGKAPLKYNYVIFVGSVCKRSECPVVINHADYVINDCSPIDIWPLFAELINPWHYEATGTFGFLRVGVEDRFFTRSHGGCLTEKHFIDFVLPIITSKALKRAEEPQLRIPYHCFGSSFVSVDAVCILPFRYETRILLIFLKKCP